MSKPTRAGIVAAPNAPTTAELAMVTAKTSRPGILNLLSMRGADEAREIRGNAALRRQASPPSAALDRPPAHPGRFDPDLFAAFVVIRRPRYRHQHKCLCEGFEMLHATPKTAREFSVQGVTFRSFTRSATGSSQLGAWQAEFAPPHAR